MTQRGRCRCGKILTFRPGPDGLKRRCPRCGSVVRLRLDPAPPPEDVNATSKQVPVWSYARTEELQPAAAEIDLGSTGNGPMLPPAPPVAEGTGEREFLDAVAGAEWVALEEAPAPAARPRGRWRLMALVAAGAVLAAGAGYLVAHWLRS
jgi:phage FluMu protein Com